MADSGEIGLRGERATMEWGARLLAPLLAKRRPPQGALMTLDGPLGAGKSTLVRAMLRAAGVGGPVPSPTYALVEPYVLPGLTVLHLDLYRLSDPDELAMLGLDQWRGPDTVTLVEWSSRLPGVLGTADLSVELAHGKSRDGSARRALWQWRSEP
ncbi:MAG: tRNA (adenosine(37)-N6)-threonylcarbamoyltransferase complex ATPase subunit type 1 TsaE [Pseudomonadota bacterium]